jgi:Tol biopolymer transport system component
VRFTTGALQSAGKLAFLLGTTAQAGSAIGLVNPEPDPLLGYATAKVLLRPGTPGGSTSISAFDWSPDGQSIVFVQSTAGSAMGRLRILTLRTQTVTDLPAYGSAPAWSPDGSTIAYISAGVLHSIQVHGLADSALTSMSEGQVVPPLSFTPDGKSIAYAELDPTEQPRLKITNLELRTTYRPIGLADAAELPAWSPDGTKLAFLRLTSAGPQVFVYDLTLSSPAAYRKAVGLAPTAMAWLNDNSTLVAAVGSEPQSELFRINVFAPLAPGGLTRLTGSPAAPTGSEPATPLYDRRIAFEGFVAGLPQILVMNGDGSSPQQLSRWSPAFPYAGMSPEWSPAG